MTVVAAFYCTDGVVIAADSMITPSMGNLFVGNHKRKKVEILAGSQVFAFAGDIGQAARFKIMADGAAGNIAEARHPLDYPLRLTQAMIQQFSNTGIVGNQIGVNTLLGYVHNGAHQCCVFEGALQPRLLDAAHYYVALGSGKLSADPFLRFVVDIFCKGGQPKVREAIFLSTWVVQHAIETSSGGVDGPIRIAVIERDSDRAFGTRELSHAEIDQHLQAVESAGDALRNWQDEMLSGDAARDAPTPPAAGAQ